jgi:hypothetical protein
MDSTTQTLPSSPALSKSVLKPIPRASAEDVEIAIQGSPDFRFAALSAGNLSALADLYHHVTGQRVTTLKQANLLAAAYRVHGRDLEPRLRLLHAATGSATNLLLAMRTCSPHVLGLAAADVMCGCPVAELLPAAFHCERHAPTSRPIVPTPTRGDQPTRSASIVASRQASATTHQAKQGDRTVLAAAFRVFGADLTEQSRRSVLQALQGWRGTLPKLRRGR